MTAQKALTLAGVAFTVIFILTSPNDSSGIIRSGFDGIRSAAEQLAAYVMSMAGR